MTLTEMLKAQVAAGKCTAAICAAPAIVLKAHDLLPPSFTHFPAPPLREKTGEGYSDSVVVVDGCVITSQGPGTALQFALKIVEKAGAQRPNRDRARAKRRGSDGRWLLPDLPARLARESQRGRGWAAHCAAAMNQQQVAACSLIPLRRCEAALGVEGPRRPRE